MRTGRQAGAVRVSGTRPGRVGVGQGRGSAPGPPPGFRSGIRMTPPRRAQWRGATVLLLVRRGAAGLRRTMHGAGGAGVRPLRPTSRSLRLALGRPARVAQLRDALPKQVDLPLHLAILVGHAQALQLLHSGTQGAQAPGRGRGLALACGSPGAWQRGHGWAAPPGPRERAAPNPPSPAYPLPPRQS